MGKGDHLVLLLLQCRLELRERNSVAKRCNNLVHLRAVGTQAVTRVNDRLTRRAYPNLPVGETIAEVTAVEDKRVLAGLNEVGRNLTIGPV